MPYLANPEADALELGLQPGYWLGPGAQKGNHLRPLRLLGRARALLDLFRMRRNMRRHDGAERALLSKFVGPT